MASKKIQTRFYSYSLVFLQFFLIFVLGFNSVLANFNMLIVNICIAGLLLGLWALWVTRKTKMTIFPEVRKSSTLITNGPYKFIRHPMYSSVLLFSLGLLLTNLSFRGLIVFLILFLVLSLKVKYEEVSLSEYFSEYNEYRKYTKKLIPFLF